MDGGSDHCARIRGLVATQFGCFGKLGIGSYPIGQGKDGLADYLDIALDRLQPAGRVRAASATVSLARDACKPLLRNRVLRPLRPYRHSGVRAIRRVLMALWAL